MQNLFEDALAYFIQPSQPSVASPSLVHLLVATSKAIDLLEYRPIRHGLRLAVMAGSLATALELPNRTVFSTVFAGLVHDVGLVKIAPQLIGHLPQGVSINAVLALHPLMNARIERKGPNAFPNPVLSDEARSILHSHPQMAASWLEHLPLSRDIAEVIAGHHELADGSGYPLGISLENIPMGSRLLALADCAESMIQDVNGLSARKEALESFLEDAATMGIFDPAAVQVARKTWLQEDFIRQLFNLDVEGLVYQSLPDAQIPLSASGALTMVQALSSLSDQLMPGYTNNHSRRVAEYALSMAQHLGINNAQCGELMFAAMLHDVGKLSVPVSSLLKQGILTKDEWAVIHDYPRWSEEVLKGIPGFQNVAVWAGQHHERINGSGYPSGSKSHEISLAGRIIGLADVFESLTSVRPYRPHCYEMMDAIAVIEQGRFRLYDNKLVSLLKKVVLNTEVSSVSAR